MDVGENECKSFTLNDCDMSAEEWTCVHCVVDVDHDKQY